MYINVQKNVHLSKNQIHICFTRMKSSLQGGFRWVFKENKLALLGNKETHPVVPPEVSGQALKGDGVHGSTE